MQDADYETCEERTDSQRWPEASDALGYAKSLRSELNALREALGGSGDVIVAVLTQRGEPTLVRLMFTAGHGNARHAPEDDEWHACMRWLEGFAAYSGTALRPRRLILAGDLCVILHEDELTADLAAQDARAIIDALLSWYRPPEDGLRDQGRMQ